MAFIFDGTGVTIEADVDEPDAYFLGLDLGQAQDPSALVALKRMWIPEEQRKPKKKYRYEVRGIRRWPLRTSYMQIAKDVGDLVKVPPLAKCVLGVDKTGVGAGVLEIIMAEKPNAKVRPITITAGNKVSVDGPGFNVPKLELAGIVTSLLDSDRLIIPKTVPLSELLTKELRAFKVKVTAAGNETMGADWRQRVNDDIVLALSIGAWLGEKGQQKFWVH